MVNIQPQFVKLNDNEKLPKEFRGKILYYYAMSGMIGTSVPALYVELNKIDTLFKFIKECENNVSLLLTGTDYFQIGIDYYISDTLANNLEEIIDNITNEEITDSTDNTTNDNTTNDNIQEDITDTDIVDEDNKEENENKGEGELEDETFEVDIETCPECDNPLIKNIDEGKSKECPVCGWFEYYDGEEEEEEDEEIEDIDSEDNETLVCILPDYILNNGVNTEFFDEVNNAEYLIDFYIKNNRYRDYIFNKDELNNFYATFCLLIINLTSYTDRVEVIDQIYNQVLNYFANFKADEASIGISLILNNIIMQQTSAVSACGCNNTTATGLSVSSTSCIDYYKTSMTDYLKTMLGNADFYKKWFFVKDDNYCEPNKDLCDYITKLIEEFITLGYDLRFNGNVKNACNCPVLNNTESECNYNILNNYLQVIDWIANNKIDENINKIKIYGEQFGELLPKLQF